jgi:hypothetical protein
VLQSPSRPGLRPGWNGPAHLLPSCRRENAAAISDLAHGVVVLVAQDRLAVIPTMAYLAQVVAGMLAHGIDRPTATSINYLDQVTVSMLRDEVVCHIVTTITYLTQKVTVVLTHDVNDERGMQLALVEPTVVKQVLMHALLLEADGGFFLFPHRHYLVNPSAVRISEYLKRDRSRR